MCSISPMLIIQTFLKMPSQSLLTDEEVGQREGDLISDLSASLFYLCLTAVKWALLSLTEGYGSSDTADERAPALSGESHLFPLTCSVKWIEAEPLVSLSFFTTPAPVPPLPVSLPFLFPCWVLTPFLQLQHTARMMGLRFALLQESRPRPSRWHH